MFSSIIPFFYVFNKILFYRGIIFIRRMKGWRFMIISTSLFASNALYGFLGLAAAAGLTNAVISDRKKLASGKKGSVGAYQKYLGDDGVVVGKNMQLSALTSFEGVLVLGPTGSGKSVSILAPTIDKILDNDNLILVSDPKGELYQAFRHRLIVTKKDVYRINLGDGENSDCFCPLVFCQSETEVSELAQNIIINGRRSFEMKTGQKSSDPEWLSMATTLFEAYLLLLWSGEFKAVYDGPESQVEGVTIPRNIPEIVRFILAADSDILAYTILGNDYEPASERYAIYCKSMGSERTNSSINTIMADCLRLFATDKSIMNIMYSNSIDPEKLRSSSKIIFIQYPEAYADYYSPFTSVFYGTLMNRLKTEESQNGDGVDAFILGDELANIGVIQGLDKYVTTCRSKRISFVGALQSLSQLVDLYGENKAKTIRTNLKTKVLFPGLEEDADYFSDYFGEKQVKVDNSTQRRKILDSREIRQLHSEKVIICRNNSAPLIRMRANKIN